MSSGTLRGERLQHVLAGLARRDLRLRGKLGDRGEQRRDVGRPLAVFSGRVRTSARELAELVGELRVLGLPGVEGLGPGRVGGRELLLARREERAHLGRDEVGLRRQPEALARRVGELRAALAVRLLRALDLGDALADERLGDDELRLAAARPLGALEGGEERLHLVAVDRLDVEAERLEALGRVLALRLLGHRVERDGVRVVDEDQVVELLMAGEGDRLHRDALLHAAVAREADDVVIEDGVLGGVEAGLGHLRAAAMPTALPIALTERTGRRLDAARRVRQLRVPRRLASRAAGSA